MAESDTLIPIARRQAAARGLPPHIVCAICERESSWDPWAIRYEPAFQRRYVAPLGLDPTSAVARSISWGLMQIMGQSARGIGYTGPFPTLCDPATGLEWGCRLVNSGQSSERTARGTPRSSNSLASKSGSFFILRGELGAVAGKGDWKSILAEKALDNLPEFIKTLQEIFNARVREAEALRQREEARARTVASVRGIQQPAFPSPSAIPAAAAAPGTNPSQPPLPPAAAPSKSWPGLAVVPLETAAPESPVMPAGSVIAEESDAQKIEQWLKTRVVQLIAENADPTMLVDFIDGAMPVVGSMLSRASEAQLREFLAKDPVLAQATKLSHFEEYLGELVECLHDTGGGEPEDHPRKPNWSRLGR